MIGKEDQKVIIEKFKGLYSRGSVDEVPLDHAQDLQNTDSVSDGRVQTRWGILKTLNLGHNVRQMFLSTALPANIDQPFSSDPDASDGQGILHIDNSGNMYMGNDTTPVISDGGMTGFAALNMGNRTYISPNADGVAIPFRHLKVYNPLTGDARDAAGIAPHQSSSFLTAAESGTSGNVTPGVHKFAVIYQTDTGFWTQPGPKKRLTISAITASSDDTQPTICTCVGHGMSTGESHYIQGSSVAELNDAWHITRIDDDTFSIPLDTFGGSGFGSPTIDAGVQYATVTCVGGKKIHITNIPTGPAGTVARLILATQADGAEFFFIPNVPGCQSEIDDNTTTSCLVDFFDTDLVASADYLFDILEFIPAGAGMCKYRGRMVIGGPVFPGESERLILSNVGDYETFNYVSGYVQVQTERDGNVVTCPFVLRDVLYMCKLTGMFSTIDNGGDPSTWAVSVVDDVLGFYTQGCSAFTASQQTASDTGDIIGFAHPAGFYIFDGVVRRPELSWKIDSFWRRINVNAWQRVQCAHDPWLKRFYIIAPLDGATEPTAMLMCDYSSGRDKDAVRWHIWHFPFNISTIGMYFYESNVVADSARYSLKLASLDSGKTGIWVLDSSATDDAGTKITSYYVPGPITFGLGGVNFFKLLNFRAWGTGRVNLTLAQEDGQNTVTPPYLTLSATPGRELQRQINFADEKLTLKFSNGDSTGDQMFVDRVDIWGQMRWALRPSV